METIALKEPSVLPTRKNLENALGKTYAVYEELMAAVTRKGVDLIPRWNYYNDGKAWLCKVQHGKKTVFWLSAWDGYFKLAFYFTEQQSKGINKLDIDETIKKSFAEGKPVGRLLPLSAVVNKKKQLKDILKLVEYKKNLV